MSNLALQADPILARIAAGEYPGHIADDIGIARSTLTERYHGNPAYLQARELGWEHRLDSHLQALEQTAQLVQQDPLADPNLARTRTREAVLKRVEWRASVEFPERWGSKTQVNVAVAVRVEERLERDLGSLLTSVADKQRQDSMRVMSNTYDADTVASEQQTEPSLPSLDPSP